MSIVPEFTSTPLISTEPEPLPERTRSAFDVVTLMTLSVKLIVESMVRFATLTTPVPPGVRFRSALELVEIMLSLNVRLSTVMESANDVAPDTVMEPSVVVPETVRVPVVDKFSLPKLIAPDESFIIPLSRSN